MTLLASPNSSKSIRKVSVSSPHIPLPTISTVNFKSLNFQIFNTFALTSPREQNPLQNMPHSYPHKTYQPILSHTTHADCKSSNQAQFTKCNAFYIIEKGQILSKFMNGHWSTCTILNSNLPVCNPQTPGCHLHLYIKPYIT